MTGKQLVFAGGAPRSGLTLLRAILSAHSQIFCGPDSGILPGLALQWREFSTQLGALHHDHLSLDARTVRENFATAIWNLLAEAPAAANKTIIVEKTPLNILAFLDLAALFPEAKFIHVVRDGRDVAASLLQRDWRDPQSGAPFPHVTDAASAAAYWNGIVAIGRQIEKHMDSPDRLHILSYEALTRDPKKTLRNLFLFLDAPLEDQAFRFYENDIALVGIEAESRDRLKQPLSPDRIGRWRRDFSSEQRKAVTDNASTMLQAFRYTRR